MTQLVKKGKSGEVKDEVVVACDGEILFEYVFPGPKFAEGWIQDKNFDKEFVSTHPIDSEGLTEALHQANQRKETAVLKGQATTDLGLTVFLQDGTPFSYPEGNPYLFMAVSTRLVSVDKSGKKLVNGLRLSRPRSV